MSTSAVAATAAVVVESVSGSTIPATKCRSVVQMPGSTVAYDEATLGRMFSRHIVSGGSWKDSLTMLADNKPSTAHVVSNFSLAEFVDRILVHSTRVNMRGIEWFPVLIYVFDRDAHTSYKCTLSARAVPGQADWWRLEDIDDTHLLPMTSLHQNRDTCILLPRIYAGVSLYFNTVSVHETLRKRLIEKWYTPSVIMHIPEGPEGSAGDGVFARERPNKRNTMVVSTDTQQSNPFTSLDAIHYVAWSAADVSSIDLKLDTIQMTQWKTAQAMEAARLMADYDEATGTHVYCQNNHTTLDSIERVRLKACTAYTQGPVSHVWNQQQRLHKPM